VAEGGEDRARPREWWRNIEPVHAVTYFAPESRDTWSAAGLRGFWMGYFATRAAPLGAVGAATVTATFFNFHPAMVGRAIPDAWRFAPPADVMEARRSGAAQALRRIDPTVESKASFLVPPLERMVSAADGSGRVLFSANRALGSPHDPVEALWQACTCLREHRGDGHVAALTTSGLSGSEALVLFALSEDLPGALFRHSRGWSDEEWESAQHRLEERGLVHDGRISAEGLELRHWIERSTDEQAAPPYLVLGDEESVEVRQGLGSVASAVAARGEIPFPNPMGLPAPGQR
jgi:hypothetical protein